MAARVPQLASSTGPSVGAGSVASRGSTSVVTPAVLALSDSSVAQFDAHLLDYLNIEMLQIIIDSAAHAQERQNQRRAMIEQEFKQLQYELAPVSLSTPGPGDAANGQSRRDSQIQPVDALSQQAEEGLRTRMEAIGFRLGCALAERLARERAPIQKVAPPAPATGAPMGGVIGAPLDSLEAVKFLCKEVWANLYDKQIDNLRTNHRGVFVLTDNAFKPIVRLSTFNTHDLAMRDAAMRKTRQMLYLPCGIIRGAMSILGIVASVTVECSGGAQCIFTIKTTLLPAAPKVG